MMTQPQGPVWARKVCRINPPGFLAECRKKRLNQASYRAMHFSAKRGIAIACRLSVCLSVCP